jgi:hypothetical protein
MFAPFSIPSLDKVGSLVPIHWGNVDTGAMVNVVYLGVTRVFKTLQQYWVKYDHVLYGVGGKQTKIVAMLKDVPIRMGCHTAREPDAFGPDTNVSVDFKATFLVVDNDDYHWILGIPLLAGLNGLVHCRDRTLQYTPPGTTSTATLHLITRTEAKT